MITNEHEIQPLCALEILEDLKRDILDDKWVNTPAQKHVAAGVGLAIGRLQKKGFRKASGDELAVIPVQMEMDYNGTDISQ